MHGRGSSNTMQLILKQFSVGRRKTEWQLREICRDTWWRYVKKYWNCTRETLCEDKSYKYVQILLKTSSTIKKITLTATWKISRICPKEQRVDKNNHSPKVTIKVSLAMLTMMMMMIIIIIIIIHRKFQGIKLSSDKYFIRLSEIRRSTPTLYSRSRR
jgi:hypothetical protein